MTDPAPREPKQQNEAFNRLLQVLGNVTGAEFSQEQQDQLKADVEATAAEIKATADELGMTGDEVAAILNQALGAPEPHRK